MSLEEQPGLRRVSVREGGMRAGLRGAGALFALALLAACTRGTVIPIAAGKDTRALLSDGMWLDTDPKAARGSYVVFLSDGGLLMASCGEGWRLSPWRMRDDSRLVWEEDGHRIEAEVAMVGGDALAITLRLESGEELSRSFRRARAPIVCPGG